MGKLTLLFVFAAILGGMMLSRSARTMEGQTAGRIGQRQSGDLAREIAQSGQNLLAAQMVGANGFVAPGAGTVAYGGGAYSATFTPTQTVEDDVVRARLTVTGTHGGASHVIESEYEFDPMDLPAPLWLDVPYATIRVLGTPTLVRLVGAQDAPVLLDARQHAALGLQPYLPIASLDAQFDARLGPASAWLDYSSSDSHWQRVLEDVNVSDAEQLYQAALTAMDASDTMMPGGTTSTPQTVGGPARITRVVGPLTVQSTFSGQGVLIVEGALVVAPDGSLSWDGLVIVRAESDIVPVEFHGPARISGALVVRQEPAAPLGHLDVTVFRNASGLSSPQGAHQAAPWSASPGPYPWTQHSHRFDLEHAEGRHVYFLEDGGPGRHEAETQFAAAIAAAGSDEVYLEFENEAAHGFGRYTLDVDGLGSVSGRVRSGFPSGVRATSDAFRTRRFDADDLQTLTLDLRTLSALRRRFDTEGGCASWPFCIGDDWNRGGALRLRLRRASGSLLYEAVFYWHMRQDEVATHDAELAAFRDAIAAGAGFGTHLVLGDALRLTYSRGHLQPFAERLGFDGNEVRLLTTSTRHRGVRDAP